VPGTQEAKDAVLISQVPTIAVVSPAAAEKGQGQILRRARVSTDRRDLTALRDQYREKVIKAGETYYLCLNAVWFQSSTPNGPWTTAKSIPEEIYNIPPSSPMYNVTYVEQEVTDTGEIEASYTSGYDGYYADESGVMYWGTGYWYPPYFYYGLGYPYYWGWPITYGWGAFALGAAWGAAWGAWGPWRGGVGWGGYNPYTGTVARGARISGPYGSRGVAAAYNARTGTGLATRQGSGPYGSWGKSVATRGGQAIKTGHISTAAGYHRRSTHVERWRSHHSRRCEKQ
jgi:hypothetical protein